MHTAPTPRRSTGGVNPFLPWRGESRSYTNKGQPGNKFPANS
ncbi:MAG: hypothetical protein RLP02_18075 [Coleofasciculus sp. C2-GNP5-27]